MLEMEIGKFRTIDDFELKGKRVLVRADLNSPIIKGNVEMNERIKQHALTLKELSEKEAKVVVLAHQGRPGDEDYTESMEQHAKLLSRTVKVDYVNDLIGDEALNRIKNTKDGEVLLLKNVRSFDEEFKPSPGNVIVKTLAPMFDLFVSDAFSVLHRDQTSVTSFAQVLTSCVGRVLEKELSAVKNLQNKKMIYILGGAKPEDNIILARDTRAEKVLSTGIFSLLCLMAKDYKLGKEEELLEKKLVPEIKKIIGKIETPVDLAFYEKGRKEVDLEKLPVDKEILDIGKKTVEKYKEEIRKAEAVFMKGPAGKFEQKGFEKGTLGILKAIASSKCFSLIGGGHSSHLIESFNIRKDKFSHISLAGGALIAFLAGEKLPGLEVLKI